MTELEKRLQEIENRLKQATDGPWALQECVVYAEGVNIGLIDMDFGEDADFLLHTRDDIPYLLQQLRASLEREWEYRWFLRDLRDNYDCENDAHRYNNGACRVCNATNLLASTRESRGES